MLHDDQPDGLYNEAQPTEAEQRCALAEGLGWTHYASGHNATPEQKAAAKWWNNTDPAELVELPTLDELLALANTKLSEPVPAHDNPNP